MFQIYFSEEFRWRDWADHQFVHMVYPNIYRTHAEAVETYNWFADMGKWDHIYPNWFRALMVHAGAVYMLLISKRLKKRHHLSDDVRQQFYDVCDKWTDELERLNTQFHGGNAPDLADLAVFGALNSFEGCRTFKDVMDNTKISETSVLMLKLMRNYFDSHSKFSITEPWFIAMRENEAKHKGNLVVST